MPCPSVAPSCALFTPASVYKAATITYKVLARTQLLYISHLLTLYNTVLASQEYGLLFIVFYEPLLTLLACNYSFHQQTGFYLIQHKIASLKFSCSTGDDYLSWCTRAWTISSLLFSFYFFVIVSSMCCSSSILQTNLVSVSFLVYNIIHLCITSCYLTDRSIFRVQWFIVFDA